MTVNSQFQPAPKVTTMPSNDNDLEASPRQPLDPHGHAALLLVESLIHGLIEQSVLTTTQSLEIVTAAIDVQDDYAVEAGESGPRMQRSSALLNSIAESLRYDADNG